MIGAESGFMSVGEHMTELLPLQNQQTWLTMRVCEISSFAATEIAGAFQGRVTIDTSSTFPIAL